MKFWQATLTKSEIAALSVDERVTLIEEIWDSFENPQQVFVSPEWHRTVVEQTVDEEERNPHPTISWSELRSDLAKKWLA